MPKVSVLMPAYNVERYIRECLDSVIGQSLEDLEIICIDDGSKDRTGDILDEYAAKDSRILVVHKENSGYGASMNVGLDKATGDYIGIVETDDFIDAEMFQRLCSLADEKSADVVKANYYDYYSGRPEKCKKTGTLDIAGMYEKVFSPSDNQRVFMVAPCIWSGIYRRGLIMENGIRFTETPGASYQDTAFAFKIWACADSVYLTDEAYLHYRRDNESSSVNSPGKVFCICDEYEEIENFIREKGKAQFEDIKNAIKFNHYRWNYNRLGVEYRYAFLLRIVEEFGSGREAGRLKQEAFDDHRWEELMTMLDDPQKYFIESSRKKMGGCGSVAEMLEENKDLKKRLKRATRFNIIERLRND